MVTQQGRIYAHGRIAPDKTSFAAKRRLGQCSSASAIWM